MPPALPQGIDLLWDSLYVQSIGPSDPSAPIG